jgi:choline dehydrogenase-like flavoprotein
VAKQILYSMRVGAARVTEIQPDFPEADYNTAAHAMGTLRMGDSDKTSVVNAYGLSHEHKNLYVLGSSVFATAATANPTVTIAALTLRTAAEIGKRF